MGSTKYDVVSNTVFCQAAVKVFTARKAITASENPALNLLLEYLICFN